MSTIRFPTSRVKSFIAAKEDARRNIKKIEAATGCTVCLSTEGDCSVFTVTSLVGDDKACKSALKYISYCTAPSGVSIDAAEHTSDLLVHYVPSSCFPAVVSRNTAFISTLEHELGVVCFIADDKEATLVNPRSAQSPEGLDRFRPTNRDLHITKPHTGITGATPVVFLSCFAKNLVAFKFKLMQMTESKIKGLYTQFPGMDLNVTAQFHYSAPGAYVDTYPIADDELSLAMGKMGANRRRICAVSKCAVEYIGTCAFIYGSQEERQVARTLITIILERGRGSFTVSRWKGMVGVVTVEFSADQIGWLTGKQGVGLHHIEELSNTICFVDGTHSLSSARHQQDSKRKSALAVLPAPLARKAGTGADSEFSVRPKTMGESRASMVILGLEDGTNLAAKLIHERLGVKVIEPASPVRPISRRPSTGGNPDTGDITSEFEALFPQDHRSIELVLDADSVANPVNGLHEQIFQTAKRYLQLDSANAQEFHTPNPQLTLMNVPVGFELDSVFIDADELQVSLGTIVARLGETEFSMVAISGSIRARRDVELSFMAVVEKSQIGFYTHKIVRENARVCDHPWYVLNDHFDTDAYPVTPIHVAQLHEAKMTLSTASGCLVEIVGEVAYLSGTLEERTRARDYLKWHMQHLDGGEVQVTEYLRRSDMSVMPLTRKIAAFVGGKAGKLVLREIERLTGTFCFVGKTSSADTKPLLVCGLGSGREAAVFVLEQFLTQTSIVNTLDGAQAEIDQIRASLERILATTSFFKKPDCPWSLPVAPSEYPWLCQPCPGLARPSAVVFQQSEKSTVLIKSQIKSFKSSRSFSGDFVNDTSSFPELGGMKRNLVAALPSRPLDSSMSSAMSTSSTGRITPPTPPTAAVSAESEIVIVPPGKDSSVTIDSVKGQIWGDWGLGPNGDTASAKLIRKRTGVLPLKAGTSAWS